MISKTSKSIFFMIFLGLSLGPQAVYSSPKLNFKYKKGSNQNVVAKINGKEVTADELKKDIEIDLYEAEEKLFKLKLGKLKSIILNKLIQSDPRKKGLSNDEFLNKYVAQNVTISDKDIQDFIADRKIPANQVNDFMKKRIREFLKGTKTKDAVDIWLASKVAKNNVEVYLSKPQRPVFDVNIGMAPFMGNENAKVTLVEFSDFQCPHCARGSKIVDQLKKKYGDKVKVVFKNFPLPFHKDAKPAAEAGLCANEQGGKFFWKLHDEMFGDQGKLKKDDLLEKAKKVGLKEDKFKKCLESKKFQSTVESDMKDGRDAGVKSTPTFFINGKMINGALPVEVFSEVIDEELKG